MHWITSDEVYVGGWTLDRPHGIGEHIWGTMHFSVNKFFFILSRLISLFKAKLWFYRNFIFLQFSSYHHCVTDIFLLSHYHIIILSFYHGKIVIPQFSSYLCRYHDSMSGVSAGKESHAPSHTSLGTIWLYIMTVRQDCTILV